MTETDKPQATGDGAVELEEAKLDQASGGDFGAVTPNVSAAPPPLKIVGTSSGPPIPPPGGGLGKLY